MSVQQYKNVSYGLTQPLNLEAQLPIVSMRAPTAADKAQLGTIWVDKTTSAFWILTSIVNNSANWESGAGGSGDFTELTVDPGDITVTEGNIAVTVGDVTIGGELSSQGPSTLAGNFVVSPTEAALNTGDLTIVNGGIQVAAGDVTVGGALDVLGGNLVVSSGDLSVIGELSSTQASTIAGNLQVIPSEASLAAGDFVVLNGSLEALTFVRVGGDLGPIVVSGAGDPNGTVTAPHGSLYLNTTGSGVANRLWVNTNAGTAWAAVTTAS